MKNLSVVLVALVSVALAGAVGCQGTEGLDGAGISQVEQEERWNSAGAPEQLDHLGDSYEYRLNQLPTNGEAANAPWAGYYWATYRDAINYRWAGDSSESATAKYARAYGLDPAALEDAVSARSGIDSQSGGTSCTSDRECETSTGEACSKRHGETKGYCIPTWFGQCHAWAPAAIMEPEPTDPVTINGVTFQPQDIKALMTYVYNNVDTDFLGGRCNTDEADVDFDEYGRPITRSCRDTNPGAMHVVLTNWLGIHQLALVEDRTWDDEVWNQPVRGFEVRQMDEITSSEAAELMGATAVGGTTNTENGELAKDEWVHYGPFSGSVHVVMDDTSGDADLYVRNGAQPTTSNYDCRPYSGGSTETCTVTGSEVYVSVQGYAGTSIFELQVSYGGSADYIFNSDAVQFFHVATDVKYITEASASSNGNLNEDTYTRTDRVEYILELDGAGRIIGGEWVKNSPHADFLWAPYAPANDYYIGSGFRFEYSKLKDLLDQSVGATPPPPPPTGDTVTVTESGTAARQQWLHFGPYPAKPGTFKVVMTGTNDADLYVRAGAQPTTSSYDCRPYDDGSAENCTLTVSTEGDIYVSVYGYSTAASAVSLTITYVGENGPTGPTPVSVSESGTIAKDQWQHYGPFQAASDFSAVMTGTGDADLYVREGSQPTSSSYDCRPYDGDSTETCTGSGSGEFYVSVSGYAASSDYTLTITYNE